MACQPISLTVESFPMKRSFYWLMLLALVLPLAAVRPARSMAPAASIRVRIGVTTDGITQVTPADLLAAGVDPVSVDPQTFALSSQGQPVAIRVEGEADGQFSGADRLLFFGEKFRGPEMLQKYTDENVYWLEIGGTAGPRIAEVDAAPTGDLTAPAHFTDTVHAEESLVWWTHHTLSLARNGFEDTWFWRYLTTPTGAGQVITATMPYTIPYPAAGQPARFRLHELSRSGNVAVTPDHRTTIAVNGYAALDQTWDGKWVLKTFATTLPAGTLTHGLNTIAVGAWNPPNILGDQVMANYWEVDYRREFRAWERTLAFTTEADGPQEYQTTGWVTGDVAAWDVSNPRQPIALANVAITPDGAGYAARLRSSAAAGTRYWLQEAGAHHSPASVRRRDDTGLRAPTGGADAVIITPAALRGPAERLAEWHRAQGRRAVVADLQDVFDEFNGGIYHPQAVPEMLRWARDHWTAPAPKYLTLFGDGHWNFKGYNPANFAPTPIMIPPYLAWVDLWQGEVPADALYGDLDGDQVPDLAVGRLTVNTVAEANAVVAKIEGYDQTERSQPWQKKALFVADNTDSAGNFASVSDEVIAGYLPSDLEVTRAYLPGSLISVPPVPATSAQIAETRAIISNTLQSGVWMVQYAGHGAIERWASEGLWQASDIPGLTNNNQLPVVMTFNCLDGYYAYAPTTSSPMASVAELMLRQPNGGAIAAISPSGLGTTPEQTEFRKILLDVIFKENVREIGAALTTTKTRFYQRYGNNYLLQTMMLFGEPALRLPGAVMPATPTPTATATPTVTPTATATLTATPIAGGKKIYLPLISR